MTVPTVLFPPTIPFTSQVTAAFGGVVEAVNCWVAPAAKVAEVGETEMGGGGVSKIAVDAVMVESALETTVTVTGNSEMILAGAV